MGVTIHYDADDFIPARPDPARPKAAATPVGRSVYINISPSLKAS